MAQSGGNTVGQQLLFGVLNKENISFMLKVILYIRKKMP